MSRHYQVTVDGISFEVDLLARTADSIEFLLNGATHRVVISAPISSRRAGIDEINRQSIQSPSQPIALSTSNSNPAGAICAPMPGIVAKMLVNLGDTVAIGQPMLVIEAMKMENSICAAKAGTIKSLEVTLGSEVKKGQVLVIIE
jgi:biotin carboxyl carrier protein